MSKVKRGLWFAVEAVDAKLREDQFELLKQNIRQRIPNEHRDDLTCIDFAFYLYNCLLGQGFSINPIMNDIRGTVDNGGFVITNGGVMIPILLDKYFHREEPGDGCSEVIPDTRNAFPLPDITAFLYSKTSQSYQIQAERDRCLELAEQNLLGRGTGIINYDRGKSEREIWSLFYNNFDSFRRARGQ